MYSIQLDAFLTVLIISIVFSTLVALIYKFTTNQAEMKRLRERLKSLQAQIKTSQGDQEKMLKLNSEMLKVNGEYMKKSFKSSFYTIIPAMILFWYLISSVAYAPILPGSEMSILLTHNADADQSLTTIELPEGFALIETIDTAERLRDTQLRYLLAVPEEEGTYTIAFTNNESRIEHDILITTSTKYLGPEQRESGALRSSKVEYASLSILTFPFWPYRLNWLALYIILSILFGQLARKLLKTY